MTARVRLLWKRLSYALLRNRRWTWVMFASYLVLLCTFAVWGDRGLIQSYKLSKRKGELQKQIGILEQEIIQAKADYDLKKSNDRVLEKIAREELNMSRPNEWIFVFKKRPE